MDLVTGSSGFVGSALVRALLRSGRSVRGFDIIASSAPFAGEMIRGDVRDRAAVARAMTGIEHVYHVAARVPLEKAGDDFEDVNARGSQIVAEEALNAGVKAFVHTSSSAVIGIPKVCPVPFDVRLNPIDPYGKSKAHAEAAVQAVMARGLKASIIRPRTIVGGGRLGIFSILFDWIRLGKRIYLIGSGDNQFQFLHVDDLVSALIAAATRDVTGVFQVGAATFGTLRHDLEALVVHANTRSKIVGLPIKPAIEALRLLDHTRLSPLAPWHYLTYHEPFFFDLRREAELLDWRPKYTNVEALIEAYESFVVRAHSRLGSAHTTPIRERALRVLRWFS